MEAESRAQGSLEDAPVVSCVMRGGGWSWNSGPFNSRALDVSWNLVSSIVALTESKVSNNLKVSLSGNISFYGGQAIEVQINIFWWV